MSLEITDRDAWVDHVATPLLRSAFGVAADAKRTIIGSANKPTAHAVRLEAARVELDEITAALKRIEGSRDTRAAGARAALEAARERAAARVDFLGGLEAAFAAADAEQADAAAAVAEANHRLNNCEPDDAAARSIELATCQARLRQAHRGGLALLDGWRQSAAPVAPALAAALARAEALQQAIESLRQAARDDDPLAVAVEPAGDCPHWAAIVRERAKRAAGKERAQ